MTHRYQSSCKQEQWLKQVVTRGPLGNYRYGLRAFGAIV